MKKETPIKSPDALELRAKPVVSARIGKIAGFAAISIVALAGVIIAVNIATHKGAGLKQGSKDGSTKLATALPVAQEMCNQVPEKGVIPLNATQPPPLEPKKETTQPQPVQLPDPEPKSPAPQDQQALKRDRVQEEREAALRQALTAGTPIENFQSNSGKTSSDQQSPATESALAALARNIRQNSTTTPGPLGQGLSNFGDEPDLNRQSQKLAFLEKAMAQLETPYLPATRKAPLSPLEIKTGTIIPAFMIEGINSDLPGDLIAQVSENVYDTAAGQHLLIPQGTKVFGTYDSEIAYGQNRLLVVWKRLIFPDGSTLELAGMPGADSGGFAGFHDKVDNHYLRLIGWGVFTSMLTAGFQLSQPANNNVNNNSLTPMQIGAAAAGQQFSQLGLETARRNMRVQPTIMVRPGYRFVIKVNRDVIFPSAYNT
jgi:type IV secretion system protein TrbI